MRLVLTLLVRDEADIVEANILFHLRQGVDFIVAMDNLSTDKTPQILHKYQNAGVLHYLEQRADVYDQSRWVTDMSEIARTQHGADWVICCDADEFWWPHTGTLKTTLEEVPSHFIAAQAARSNFLAVPGNEPFYDRMIYRERVSFNNLGKPLPGKVAHRAIAGIVVEQGNHSVRSIPSGAVAALDATILHFPVRSLEQIENKIAKGGAAYERNTQLPESIGGTWRALYKELNGAGHLRQYFQSCCVNRGQLSEELESGTIVVDRRLSEYMRSV
jgi:hypothetical protein